MNFIVKESKLVNLCFFLILIFSLILLIFFNLSCETTLNQKNYSQCLDKLEEERQKVRVGKGFSYIAQDYEECRAPARYRLDSD